MSPKPKMVLRSFYVPLATWEAAKAKAEENEKNISDVLRDSLERYARSRR